MCGRYLAVSSPEELADHFEADEIRTEGLRPRYNVAPTMTVYAVLEDEGARRLGTLRWGFVPHWTRRLQGARQPINARLETVATSRMFAPSFARRRCLLPADGFYEWQDRGEGRRRQPYHLADPDGAPLALAGVHTAWRDPDDPEADPLYSAAIVTTAAQGELRRLHERSPLILPRGLWHDWLTADEDQAPHLLEAVRRLQLPALRATPVSTRVNDVRNDGPELLDPAEADAG